MKAKCKRCGEPFEQGSSVQGDYCDECARELLDIIAWQNKTKSETDVICPWCGEPMPLEYTWSLDDWDRQWVECPNCGQSYELEVMPLYVTKKPEYMYREE